MADGTLKVGTITTSSGSGTITLGQSGETISIPSGATLTNSGTATGFGGGKLLQVITASTSTETRSSSNSFIDTTLTASITPSATSSKVLVTVFQNGCDKSAGSTDNKIELKLLRGSTFLTLLSAHAAYSTDAESMAIGTIGTTYLDSPSTTSATTYKTQMKSPEGTSNIGVQGTGSESSTILLMEIAG